MWAELGALGRARRFPSGSVLIGQGERSDHVLLVTRGRVKVVATTEDGRETVLGVRGPGELIGELAAVDPDPGGRVATVVADGPVEAREVSAGEFRDHLARHPAAAVALLRVVVGRLRSADRRRVEFGGYDTTTRLAHLLAELTSGSEGAGGQVSPGVVAASQHELAAMIGASRESVARSLARLREHGLVASSRRSAVVLDREALERYGRELG